MRNWRPDIDLDRLMSALGEEIIVTDDEALRLLAAQSGYPIAGAARAVRRLIAAIDERPDTIPSATAMPDRRAACPRSH